MTIPNYILADADYFPRDQPPGYAWLDDEAPFEPVRDLALSEPSAVRTLKDLGYPIAFRQSVVSPLAITAPFRVLSDEGIANLRASIGALEPFIRRNPTTRRVPAVMRGSVFRSRFIRDLSLCPAITAHFSAISGTPLRPTLFAHQLGHLNFAPEEIGREVNGWHYDVNSMVMVLMLHDPAKTDGGEFEYFNGPRWAGRAALLAGDIPDEQIVRSRFPGPGWAILMQGCAIFHHARPLRVPGERISLVTSYDSLDVAHPDPNRFYFVAGGFGSKDPNALLERQCRYTEWARYHAWRCRAKLARLMQDVPYSEDRQHILELMRRATAEFEEAIVALERGDVTREEALTLRAAVDRTVEPV